MIQTKFGHESTGAYVHVYKRASKAEVRIDVNFFEGDYDLEEIKIRQKILNDAIEYAEKVESGEIKQ